LDFEIKALDEKGAEAISQQIVAYNGYFSELRLHDLATLKADGGVIAVDERAIRDQPASADTSSPYFDERRQRIIAYSNVAPGEKVRDLQGKKARIGWESLLTIGASRQTSARGDRTCARRAGL
jgi:hypothetical protein